jgi:hypothetical protein
MGLGMGRSAEKIKDVSVVKSQSSRVIDEPHLFAKIPGTDTVFADRDRLIRYKNWN